jgi:hypothetical protein
MIFYDTFCKLLYYLIKFQIRFIGEFTVYRGNFENIKIHNKMLEEPVLSGLGIGARRGQY